ncbi:peptidase associated/transthyretin-like domain-containing protein [Halobiforma nitratireducens]|nr:hypothetical protein [Halobiforma nitratireducens]
MESGEYNIEVEADGYVTKTETVTVGSDGATRKDFELEPVNAGTLSGSLVDENGDPVDSSSTRVDLDGDRSLMISPETNQEFEVDLQDDLWILEPEALGYEADREIVPVNEGETTELEVEMTSNDEGQVRIFIWVDEDDVPSTDITLENPTGDDYEISHTNGDAKLEVEVEEGSYIVEVQPDGYDTQVDAVEVEHGSSTTTNFSYT